MKTYEIILAGILVTCSAVAFLSGNWILGVAASSAASYMVADSGSDEE